MTCELEHACMCLPSHRSVVSKETETVVFSGVWLERETEHYHCLCIDKYTLNIIISLCVICCPPPNSYVQILPQHGSIGVKKKLE